MRSTVWLVIAGAVAFLFVGASAGCGHFEHEEHPTSEHPMHEHPTPEKVAPEHPTPEHPSAIERSGPVFAQYAGDAHVVAQEHPVEHPKPKPRLKPLSMDELAAGIEGYIAEDTRLKGGHFLVYDQENQEVLMLALDKVHKERLARTAPDTYFACTDLKTPEGKVYDLDFWMKQTGRGLKVTEIMVHKEAGVPRYNWQQVEGLWKTVPVE